ncbi:MAG: family 10 glycosylhydrolase [Phycisphaerales bacterium]|nr:MAG: family 10 glycosylhydrolase [Phycisphaerales bacterium]
MEGVANTQIGRQRSAVGCLAPLVLFSLSFTLLVGGCNNPSPRSARGKHIDRTIRAIWVTRWDYKTPRDIATIMKNCYKAGFNTILFQVRGNGTVFYPSRIEPWADELGGRDPGFDPLAVAITEAHRRGLQLHAWVNVIPGWRGERPPTNWRQLYHTRPDWFWRDTQGRRQPPGWYVSLNPCYPEVREYLVSVMREIVGKYRVDGLHLDYIRFPNEWNDSYPHGARVPDYPRDPRTLALFKSETGKTPDLSPQRWDLWRTEKITQVVIDIRAMIASVNPHVRLSAAVGADADRARRKYFQDVRRWLELRLLDAVYPMNYEKDMPSFARRLEMWSAMRPGIPVVMGVMFDKRDSGVVNEQIKRTRQRPGHFSAFAYNSLFERLDEHGRRMRDGQSRSRADLRRKVIPHIRRIGKLKA